MEGKSYFPDGSEERRGLWIIPLQDSVEMLAALWNAVLNSLTALYSLASSKRFSNFARVNLTILPPSCFVGRVDPSNGTEFWRKVTLTSRNCLMKVAASCGVSLLGIQLKPNQDATPARPSHD